MHPPRFLRERAAGHFLLALKRQMLDSHASDQTCWADIWHNCKKKLVRVEEIVLVDRVRIFIFQELHTTSIRMRYWDSMNGGGWVWRDEMFSYLEYGDGEPVVVAHNAAVRDEVKFEYRTLAVRDDDFKVLRLGRAAVDRAAKETGQLPSGHLLSGRDYEKMYETRLRVFTDRKVAEGDGEASSDD